MNRTSLPLLLILTSAGCFSSGPERPAQGPPEWPAGQFALSATVEYNHSTGAGTQIRGTDFHSADLTIEADGSMFISCSSGLHPAEDENMVERQIRRGVRTFRCGDVTYTVRPAGPTIRGEIHTSVPDVRRERGGCIMYDDNGACMEYSYNYRETRRNITTPLRVAKKG